MTMKIAKDAKIESRWMAHEDFDTHPDRTEKVVCVQEIKVAVSDKTLRVVSTRVRGTIGSVIDLGPNKRNPLSETRLRALTRLRDELVAEAASAARRAVDRDKVLADVTALILAEHQGDEP